MDKKMGAFVSKLVESATGSFVKKEIIQHEKIHSIGFREVQLNTTNVDIEIVSHHADEMELILTTYENGSQIEFEQTDDVFRISTYKPSKDRFFGVYPVTKLQLYLPNAVVENWQIQSGTGDITISDFSMKELYINMSSGDVDISNLKVGALHVDNASGDIEVENLKVDVCDFKTSSGDTELHKVFASDIVLDVRAGDVDLSYLQTGNITISIETGSLELFDMKMGKGIIYSRMGEVEGSHISAEGLIVQAYLGDIDIKDFSGGIEGKVDSGDIDLTVINDCTVNLEAKTGDILLRLAKVTGTGATYDITSDTGDIDTNLPIEVKGTRLVGVTGDGENTVRIYSDAGDVEVYLIK